MKDYPDQTRNLNPTPAARVAMVMFGDEYGPFGGGSMDFWDTLSADRKRRCQKVVEQAKSGDLFKTTGEFKEAE